MTPKLPDSLRDFLKHIYQQLTAPIAVEFTPPPRTDRDDDRESKLPPDQLYSWGWSMYGHW